MTLPPAAAPAEGRLLAVTAMLMPGLAVFAPLGLSPLLFVSAALTAAAMAVEGRASLPPRGRSWRLLALTCAGLALWGGASALWALDGGHAAERALRLALEMGAGLLLLASLRQLSPSGRERVIGGLALGMVTATALLLLEVVTGGALLWALRVALGHSPPVETMYNRGATVLAILAIPAALAIYRKAGRSPAVLFLAALGGVLLQLPSSTAKLALIAAVLVAGLAVLLRPRLLLLGLAITLPISILAAPPIARTIPADPGTAVGAVLPASAAHRVAIWRFTAERIYERPVLGWGLDNARRIPGGTTPAWIFLGQGQPPVQWPEAHNLPLHPHNAALQIWLELGAFGILATIALLLLTLRGIALLPGPAPVQAAAAGSLVAGLLVAGLSYGVWQSWWVAALWLSAVLGAATLAGVTGQQPAHRLPSCSSGRAVR